MDSQRWHRLGEIYHSAIPLSRSERAAFLTSACSGDYDLQQEIESLLQADDSSGAFLEAPAFELGLKILSDENLAGGGTATAGDELPDKLVGRLLNDRYLVEQQLGQGGVGAVYVARDLKLHNRQVVVKILLERSLKNEWVTLKFQQEKEALARIDHPGVVGIVDTGELENGEPYIVMQYIDGISLRETIKAQPEGINVDRVASIIKQAGSALSAVHERNIYHRDLKPENIMLQRLSRGEEQVKILDFGVAKVKESLIASSTVTDAASAGTVSYMSPEQLRAQKISAASDVYSLGVIAYELVTGRRPFKAQTAAHLAEMQREGVRAKPADLCPLLSQEAEQIILKALAFDPQDRYQNASEFGNALAHALINEESSITVLGRSAESSSEMPPETIATPFEPAVGNVSPRMVSPTPVDLKEQKRDWPKIAGALAFIAILLAGGLILIKRQSLIGNNPNTGDGNMAQRTLAYWLTVQKMRDGKPYQEPFQSSGQEIFESDYKFRLNISSSQSGYLYVFNDGPDELTIIYPTPNTNNGSPKLDADQITQTNWNTFAGKTGTEKLWIVWSASAVKELEAAKDVAFNTSEGALSEDAMVKTVREFLISHSDPKLESAKDTARQRTNIRGVGDVLVKRVELEHR